MRRYPAHMKQMKSRYGKTLTGMADTHASPLYSKTTGGGREGLTPSYVAPLSDTAIAGYGAIRATTSPAFGMGNGGMMGVGNSTGANPLPAHNPHYGGSASVFLKQAPSRAVATTAAPTTGDSAVGPPKDPGLQQEADEKAALSEARFRAMKPLIYLGLAAAAGAALYGMTR
jgi:hypothetical protein